MENVPVTCEAERLAVKTVCAADIFHKILSSAEELDLLNKKLTRYVHQIQFLLTWRRGSAAIKMAGSAAKTVASVMVLAAPLHPQLRMAVNVGHRLWKFGAGLKILNTVANILRDVWQDGCRKCVLEFVHAATSMTRNLGVLGEVINDLQLTTYSGKFESNFETPRQIFNLIQPFISPTQHIYAAHIASMIFGSKKYSPIFDYVSLISDPNNKSSSVQLIRELESLNFTEFAEESESKSLIAVSTLLHVSRELLDFLDGFRQLTDKDCNFLQECLVKFTQESTTVLKVVSFLVSLSNKNKTKTRNATAVNNDTSILNTPPEISKGPESMEVEVINISDSSCASESPVQHISIDSDSMEEDKKSPLISASDQRSQDDKDSLTKSKEESTVDANLKNSVTSNLMQSFSALSGVVRKSTTVLLSIPRRSEKETTSKFQEGEEFTKI